MLFLLPLYFLKSVVEKESDKPLEACELFITVNGERLALDDYLIGVLAAEMPVSFHEEALKAQAIAARTYALRQTDYGKKQILSTTAHQVFNTPQTRKEKWQTAFAENENKLVNAIEATEGQILTYDGQLITAMFHASSQGQTESAENYGGNSIPYLQIVTSTEQLAGEEIQLTQAQLNKLLGKNFESTHYENLHITRNASNRVAKVEINGVTWTGREFRDKLQLRSTNFDWQWAMDTAVITTFGYGHGVGMSQQGANALAQSGATAQEIVAHYYDGAKLETMNSCQ